MKALERTLPPDGKTKQGLFTCKTCGREYPYETKPGTWYHPTICADCYKNLLDERRNEEMRKRLKCLPFQDWDDEKAGKERNALRGKIGHSVFIDKKLQNKSLWIHGASGTGKTRSVCFVARKAIERGYRIRYIDCMSLLGDYSSSFGNGKTEQLLHSVGTDRRVIILDDYGAGKVTERGAELLYHIANQRLINNTATWITSNIMPSQLVEWFPQGLEVYADRIKRRILDTSKIIQVTVKGK